MNPVLNLAVSGSDDGSFQFWDLRSGKDLQKLKGTLLSLHCCMPGTSFDKVAGSFNQFLYSAQRKY